MKNFKFIIKKIAEKEIEIKAKNKQEALENAIELLSTNEEYLFKNLDKNNQVYEIKLDEISHDFRKENEEKQEEISIKNEQELDKLISRIIKQIKEDIVESYVEDCNEDDEENDEESETEIEDDLPKEYDEIVCEKCENCIIVDKDLLS